jgi:uncharacterized protein YcgI (DUF1989 family)
MVKPQLVPAAQGVGLQLKRGEQLRVIDPLAFEILSA